MIFHPILAYLEFLTHFLFLSLSSLTTKESENNTEEIRGSSQLSSVITVYTNNTSKVVRGGGLDRFLECIPKRIPASKQLFVASKLIQV